ncbi:DUF3192 domain-containing protein [Shewanella hanedai]|jgi:hypothetical protein|uniref:DUF3192 domain-containing protein n=1 Tax=Shewanella hanedai TaxID=25 RepID=A0A553JJN4_SHEHA|nr:DUF3192 domain-containing protein [Shewanella hanedai]TRY12661.1 DUF3192 domain-containing protein [Shewanella hanedai]GGI94426.1 DUF3192 domain-containing protein [Shewanella hanedai]
MKSKLPVIIGSIFAAYLAFVAVVVVVYDPTPDEMDWEDRQTYINAQLSEITLGQSLVEIKTLLGKADFSEARVANENTIQVLFYRTHHMKSDGETTRDECTPLLFKDQKLIAWGEGTYQQYLTNGGATNTL